MLQREFHQFSLCYRVFRSGNERHIGKGAPPVKLTGEEGKPAPEGEFHPEKTSSYVPTLRGGRTFRLILQETMRNRGGDFSSANFPVLPFPQSEIALPAKPGSLRRKWQVLPQVPPTREKNLHSRIPFPPPPSPPLENK